MRPNLGTLLHHADAQLRALGIGQLLQTDGGGQALLGREGRGGRRMTRNESKGAPDNQSRRSMEALSLPCLMYKYTQTPLPRRPPAQVYLPLARRPQ